MNVGYVGLGRMGGALARRLQRTHALHVHDVGFTLGLMHKDMRLACDLGAASEVPLFFGSITRELYQMCISEMGPQAQGHTAALVMDRLAGTHVVPPAPATPQS